MRLVKKRSKNQIRNEKNISHIWFYLFIISQTAQNQYILFNENAFLGNIWDRQNATHNTYIFKILSALFSNLLPKFGLKQTASLK